MNEDDVTQEQLTNFERAFTTNSGGCRRTCECGREFYNPDHTWTWEPGELDALADDPNANAVDYTVGEVVFEGKEYANPCDCWHPRARKIIVWLYYHGEGIAQFLSLEKKRLLDEAKAAPVVDYHQG